MRFADLGTLPGPAMAANMGKLSQDLASVLTLVRRRSITDVLFFDEAAYGAENGDVARAVETGTFPSCYQHYVWRGRWEGRRFPVRRWGLSGSVANRLCARTASLEAHLDRLGSKLRLGELGHRLRSSDGGRVLKPAGPWRIPSDHGPWRAPLPIWARRAGCYMLEVEVDSPESRAPFAIKLLGHDGDAVGERSALYCRPERVTKRLFRIPAGCASLEVESLEERHRARPLGVRLKPLTQSFAESRIMRRLVHHHPSYLAASEDQVMAGLREVAASSKRSLLEAMWDAYESTFPRPVGRSDYRLWIDKTESPRLESLDQQLDDRLERLESSPLISVLVPTYNTDESALRACLDSVVAQSYPHWELCVVDDASPSPHVHQILEEYAERHSRIRLNFRRENGHICRASNDALAMAKGEFVALLDHDDLLARHALLQVAEAIDAHPDGELFYSDEDKLGIDGCRREPHFKPRWDPDLLQGQNYIAHLLVARTSRVREVGGFRVGYEGSQDHDLVLRLTEGRMVSRIVHIPRVLYHWRLSMQSTAAAPEAKPYTEESGIMAVRDFLSRTGTRGEVRHAEVANCYRVERALPEPAPRVSLIVPTRDAVQLLATCVDSILERTNYPDYEVIIVDNGSVRPETVAYFERVQQDSRVRVLPYDAPFNFSAINNFAARHAEAEVLGLVNNDIEVVEEGWLREMACHAIRPEIGCVGAKLLYPDRRIQHAGVVLGLHGLAGHTYRYMPDTHHGYFGRLRMTHTVSAVTAACLLVRRRIYEQVGGLDEQELAVAFNDVDFCLKVAEAGYRNLLAPRAVLLHHESATRGSDHDEDRRERFTHEIGVMKKRWGHLLHDDPYYSPHLSLDHNDYSVRVPR